MIPQSHGPSNAPIVWRFQCAIGYAAVLACSTADTIAGGGYADPLVVVGLAAATMTMVGVRILDVMHVGKRTGLHRLKLRAEFRSGSTAALASIVIGVLAAIGSQSVHGIEHASNFSMLVFFGGYLFSFPATYFAVQRGYATR